MIQPELTLPGVEVYIGDAKETVLKLAERYGGKVNCVVTSPPYFNLRDYGTASWDGGDPACDHGIKRQHGSAKVVAVAQSSHVSAADKLNRKTCATCGAHRTDKQIGIEDTVEDYVNRLAELFDAIGDNLLTATGSLWINLGDSYAGSGGAGGDYNEGGLREGQPKWKPPKTEYPSKSLMLVPERFAFEMIRRGWRLRNRVIWFKGRDTDEPLDDDEGGAPASNGMPVSADDRLKGTYEVVFHFVKSQRYFYQLDEIREPHDPDSIARTHRGRTVEYDPGHPGHPGSLQSIAQPGGMENGCHPLGRNPGDVWAIPTVQFPMSHYATFPPALVHRPVKATCPEAICQTCGTPRQAVYETSKVHRSNCGCNKQGIHFEPDDLEFIESPTGERAGEDPTLKTGRAGFDRPRGENEGTRPIRRYEQRRYAEQLCNSPHREEMERQAGTAFAHYIRTDRSGARPVPPDLLDAWLACGWLTKVEVPEFEPYGWTGGIVLDPFFGSGATAQGVFEARPPVTIDGYHCQPLVIGIDLDARNIPIVEARLTGKARQKRKPDLKKHGGGFLEMLAEAEAQDASRAEEDPA